MTNDEINPRRNNTDQEEMFHRGLVYLFTVFFIDVEKGI
jgi:hypothetical protein